MVVGVAAERASELDGQFGDMDVEEALVRAVGRGAGPEGRGKKGQHATVELESRGVGSLVEPADFVAAFFGGADDDERATAAEGKFGDRVGVGVAADLDVPVTMSPVCRG